MLDMTMADDEQRTAAIGIRTRPSLKAALEELAKADKRSLASYIEILLEEHVEQAGKQPRRKR